MSCGKTKARSITCNVLGPYFISKFINDLSQAQFYSITVDASNKGNRKMFPFHLKLYIFSIRTCVYEKVNINMYFPSLFLYISILNYVFVLLYFRKLLWSCSS